MARESRAGYIIRLMLSYGFVRLLTKYLELRAGTAVAVLYNPKTGAVLGWARDNRGQVFHVGTAAVNLQRGVRVPMKDCQIFTSHPPLVICLGTAALTQVSAIIHVAAGGDGRYKPGNKVNREAVKPQGQAKEAADVEKWMGACEQLLAENKTREFRDLFVAAPEGSLEIREAVAKEVAPEIHVPKLPPANGQPWARRDPMVDLFWMRIARKLTGLVHMGGNEIGGERAGHNIGCILVNANNQVLAWGVNTIKSGPTCHAETKCMWMFQHYNPQDKVPVGATLYTTLQSCLMCSATIKHACADNEVRVVYLDKDKVEGSVLTEGVGAREASLASIFPKRDGDNPLLGEMLMAKARWDRIRRASQMYNQNNTSTLLRDAHKLPERARLEQDMTETKIAVNPTLKEIKDDCTAALQANGAQKLGGVVSAAILNAARGALQNGGANAGDGLRAELAKGKVPEALAGALVGIFNGKLKAYLNTEAVRGRLLANLEATKAKVVAVERAGLGMDYAIGAPMLLQNPVTFEKLDRMPTLTRPGEVDEQTQLLDLATQIHGIDVLIKMLQEDGNYAQR